MKTSRRDFLAMLAASVGSGIIFSGCGGDSSPPPGDLLTLNPGPNGFRFHTVLHSSEISLPTTNRGQMRGSANAPISARNAPFKAFTGGVQITNGGHIFFQAVDQEDHVALFRGGLTFIAGIPALVELVRVVGVGDTLPDGTTVSGIGLGQGNKEGTYVTTLTRPDNTPAVFILEDDGDVAPFATMGGARAGGGGYLGGDFSCPCLDDHGNIAYVSSFVNDGTALHADGVAHVTERNHHHTNSEILFSTQDLVPHGASTTAGIGHIALSGNGHFVAQATLSGGFDGDGDITQKGQGKLPDCVIVQGKIGDPQSRKLVSARRSSSVNPRLISPDLPDGTSIYGPRITTNGIPVSVLHLDPSHLGLYYGNNLIAQTDGLSPLGNTIQSIAPPCRGGGDRIYYVLICVDVAELVLFDGAAARTILARGDRVDGQEVNSIIFGLMQNHADLDDRLGMIVDFVDGTSGIVIGTPV
ncbi:MAG: hypothetical protein AMXMBFR33_06480 [Candidatus Xenobia bacterium]